MIKYFKCSNRLLEHKNFNLYVKMLTIDKIYKIVHTYSSISRIKYYLIDDDNIKQIFDINSIFSKFFDNVTNQVEREIKLKRILNI